MSEEPVMDSTFAQKLFDATREAMFFKDALVEHMLKLCGYITTEASPFSDVTFDDYDNSMEIKGAKSDFVPPPGLHDAILALGFSHYWICFKDGSEIHNVTKSNQDSFNIRRCKYRSVEAEWLDEVKNKAYHSCFAPFDELGNHVHKFCHGYEGPVTLPGH